MSRVAATRRWPERQTRMNTGIRALVSICALAWLEGCSATRGTPFDPSLVGRQFYLCCNMGFNPHYEASDSNYGQYMVGAHQYGAGPVLAAGTKVTVLAVGSSGIAIQPVDSQTTYSLSFSYGKKQLSPSQYFHNILRDTDPMLAVHADSPLESAAITQGQLLPGMTKDEALVARGYPPAHRTPDLNANEWIYFETPGFVDRVVFVDGKIQSVTRGPAPE